jgi:hypothetical protein
MNTLQFLTKKGFHSLLVFGFLLSAYAFTPCGPEVWKPSAKNLNTSNPQQLQSNNSGVTLGVASIVKFDWIKGNYEWYQPSKQRLQQSQFVFKDGGDFVYVLPYDYTTTYRLYGSWYRSDSGDLFFEGSTGSSNGAGSGTSIHVNGRVYEYGSQLRATLSYASGANYYAKVNNTEFVNSASKRFNALVVLE